MSRREGGYYGVYYRRAATCTTLRPFSPATTPARFVVLLFSSAIAAVVPESPVPPPWTVAVSKIAKKENEVTS